MSDLTPRQIEVLRRIAEGQNMKEIASDLGISVKTAETHRLNLQRRLGIYSVARLTRFALTVGLVK